MSFDWKAHAECLAAKPPGDLPRGTGPCNADRAAMIAEGERLEADKQALLHQIQLNKSDFRRMDEQLAKAHDERDRAIEALRDIASRVGPESKHWAMGDDCSCVVHVARAALEVKP